jgi:hypothetical protein
MFILSGVVPLISIVLIAGIAFFWLNAMRTKEVAVNEAKDYCAKNSLELLDDTVALKKFSIRRLNGRLQFYRVYQFEYSDDIAERNIDNIVLHGYMVISVGRVVATTNDKDNIIVFRS